MPSHQYTLRDLNDWPQVRSKINWKWKCCWKVLSFVLYHALHCWYVQDWATSRCIYRESGWCSGYSPHLTGYMCKWYSQSMLALAGFLRVLWFPPAFKIGTCFAFVSARLNEATWFWWFTGSKINCSVLTCQEKRYIKTQIKIIIMIILLCMEMMQLVQGYLIDVGVAINSWWLAGGSAQWSLVFKWGAFKAQKCLKWGVILDFC